jgi:autotransporter-associated beta strand protein
MGSGSLRAVSGTNAWSGPINLRNSTNTNTNTYGITVTDAATTLDLSGVVSGTGNTGAALANSLFKMGAGTLSLSGSASNTLGGTLFVQEGTLQLNKSGAAVAVAGNLFIGDSRGGDNADVVSYGDTTLNPTLSSNQIADSSAVTVLNTGRLNVNLLTGTTETIASLTLGTGLNASADVTIGTGSFLNITGNITDPGLGGANTSAKISGAGALDLGAVGHIFTINGIAPGVSSLDISTAIVGFLASVTKQGRGTLEYSGGAPVNYGGTTTVNDGTLLLNRTGGPGSIFGLNPMGKNLSPEAWGGNREETSRGLYPTGKIARTAPCR